MIPASKTQKNTIFQKIGISPAQEDSDESVNKDNEEVKKHLEKMNKELKLENEMEVIINRLITKDKRQ
jgi:hypothetical protein